MPSALVTGGSRGFGLALSKELVARGWTVVVDGRDVGVLRAAASSLGAIAVPGDVSDPTHRRELQSVVERLGALDLLVNNASSLGVSPLPPLERYPLEALESVYRVNLFAPLALTQGLLPALQRARGTVVNMTSDAAVEAYSGWGGYGSSKAALDQLSAILAAEQPEIRVYAFDPGDMLTEMHQRAFPGEDISDRARPETVVPALMHLLEHLPDSGRYRASDLLADAARARP